MFAIGHFALGYLTGKGLSSALKIKLNLPLLLAVSVIPDIDLALGVFNPMFFMHRGVTHSLITYTVIMVPFFLIYGKQAIPYYAVLLSHSLVGDFFTGGIEMLWPLSQHWFGTMWIEVGTLADVAAELSLFAVSTAIMLKVKDLQVLLKPQNHNWTLIVAFVALLGPILAIGRNPDSSLPLLLIAPSLFWLALFSYSLLLGWFRSPGVTKPLQENRQTNKPTRPLILILPKKAAAAGFY